MYSDFSLFQSHLDLAHAYWSKLIRIGDIVIDATCGNGHDTLKLCELTLSASKGHVYAFDRQKEAIESTGTLINFNLHPCLHAQVKLEQRCHSSFPDFLSQESVKLIVYNLGYLPGGNKSLTTELETTLQSISCAQSLLEPGGAICLTCYPGHREGARELEAILDYTSNLSPKLWSCSHHLWTNRRKSPSLILLQKGVIRPNDLSKPYNGFIT